jgi:hypothetical protein
MEKSRPRDFAHRVSRENIERFRHASAEAKLQWLDDAFQFLAAAIRKDTVKAEQRLK